MGLLMQSVGIYRGLKIGTSQKTQKDWYALLFSFNEDYKGVAIPAEQMPNSNAMLFPANSDDFDTNSLSIGAKYQVNVSVSVSRTGGGLTLVSLKPYQQ